MVERSNIVRDLCYVIERYARRGMVLVKNEISEG